MSTASEEPSSDDNRELSELSAETRVILPAVTVLFAFLLTVPFAAKFDELGQVDRGAYFVAFMSTGLAIVLLIGESAYHRLIGHPYDKGRMVQTASHQTTGAIALLALALAAVVFLVTDVLYRDHVAVPVAIATLLTALGSWFGLPLARRLRRDRTR